MHRYSFPVLLLNVTRTATKKFAVANFSFLEQLVQGTNGSAPAEAFLTSLSL
jgi:hypothetical protein